GEPSSLTTATHFVVSSINEGHPLYANTPFDIVIEARDQNEDPAVFNQFESWTMQIGNAPTPSGIFGRLDNMQAPVYFYIEPGTSRLRISNLVYTAAEEISLELVMSGAPAFTPVTQSHHDPTSFNVTFLPPPPALSVSSTADAGYGTLRRTIETANIGGCSASPCPIGFDLPLSEQSFDGIWRIVLAPPPYIEQATFGASENVFLWAPFPAITTAVVLDATTQPGYAGTPVVEIDGGGHGFVFSLEGPASIIRGFALHHAHTAVNLAGAGLHKVESSYLGLHADGSIPDGTGNTTLGVYSEENGNVIGGALPVQGNVISGCLSAGVHFAFGALDNEVENNLIGLTPAGTAAAPNQLGVLLAAASRTRVLNNRIGGNALHGIHITATASIVSGGISSNLVGGNATANHIEGNTIGLGTGGEPLHHSQAAILIDGDGATQNVVGGPSPAQTNVIAQGSADGIVVAGNAFAAAILNNDIRSAGGLRIDLDGDGSPSVNDSGDGDVNGDTGVSGNNGQNKPVLSSSTLYGGDLLTIISVDSSAVSSTLSTRVEIFKVTPQGGTVLLTSGCFDTNLLSSQAMSLADAPVVHGDSIVATATSFTTTGCAISDGVETYYINDGTSEYSQALSVTTCSTTTPTIDPPSTVTFCSTPSITLQSSSGVTYQWLLNGSPISGADAQTYAATVPGDYSVIVTDAASCPAESVPITLSAGTAPDTPTITPDGTTSFCSGSVTLTSSTASSYLWKKNGFDIPDATNQSYVASTSGSYTVVVTNGDGCSAESDPVIVDAAASAEVPTILANGPTTFCDPGSVTLTASSGVSWQWYRNDVLLPAETGPSIEVTTSGNYKVVATDEGACAAGSAPTTVTV
ncbi:MAG TPA: hypothetical protein VF701_17215, partial [Thermoanaerobaculia bacterium]